MDAGNNLNYDSDSTSSSSTSTDDAWVADIIGTIGSGPESGADVPTAGTAEMQGSSASLNGANVSTLSFLQKMAGVQESFASQLRSLTVRCDSWEKRALYAEREVKSAEDVIKMLAELLKKKKRSKEKKKEDLAEKTFKKSVDFKGVKNPNAFVDVTIPTISSGSEVDISILPTNGLDSLERDDLLKMFRVLCSPNSSTP